jgi:hypothetical protein
MSIQNFQINVRFQMEYVIYTGTYNFLVYTDISNVLYITFPILAFLYIVSTSLQKLNDAIEKPYF